MSETKTVTIPLGYEPPAQPAQQQERERPVWARKSLHSVRMPRQEVQLEPQWVNNGPNVEVRYREVEPQQPAEQQGVNYMQDQYGNSQPQNNPELEHLRQHIAQPGPARPDPAGYDMYDPADVAAYQQANDAYMQSVIDARVQAALQPHKDSLEQMKWTRDYNDTLARYGDDPRFQEIAQIAMERVVAENGKISILQAYQEADNASNARPGVKGNAHLPEQLRRFKKTTDLQLGKITQHNHEVGRAKPLGGRNWRG